MSLEFFTIGHSTHSLDRFLSLLAMHGVGSLADVRRFPGSRKFPQYNQDDLAHSLAKAGIEYCWIEALGGRRPKTTDQSPNGGIRNESFRNYADYMLTAPFRDGVAQLKTLAADGPTALMCAEGLYWRCHRRLISDYLLVDGIAVQHIMPTGDLRPHRLTEAARTDGGRLTYPPPGGDQGEFSFGD